MSAETDLTKPPIVTRPEVVHGHYTGAGGAIFKLAFATSMLTLVTLGIYRFWARTRVRRYIWSSVTVKGDAFQYTGNGLEKLLGFLVAVIILAFTLGAIQLGLFFFNLSVFAPRDDELGLALQILAAQASLVLLAPLFFFARYRSLRYKLARTRWRGIRFALAPGAWGYAGRGVWMSLLSIVTLGIMLPYQTYHLTKYRTDRTWFGNAQMHLSGRWQSLYGAMKHIFIGIGLVVLGIVFIVMGASSGGAGAPVIGGIIIFVGYIWGIVGGIHYRVDSFKRLTEMTKLDGKLGFKAQLGTGEVVWQLFAGGFIVGGVYGLIAGIFVAVMTVIMGDAMIDTSVVAAAIPIVGVLVGLTAAGAFSMAMIVQPILRKVVNGMALTNADLLDEIQQRSEDEMVDADGLADALDFGGAI